MKTIQLKIALTVLLFSAWPTFAEDNVTIGHLQDSLDTAWTLIAAFMVFFMQAGFAMVESGFTRAKNSVNIMMKNLMDFSLGSLGFWVLGFGLMFGTTMGGVVGTSGFFLTDAIPDIADWPFAFFIFQTVFAATAATIVSGAMAERTKFSAYIFYSIIISAVIYPISGHWAWGGLFNGEGWLENLGFIDFAGSTVVHSVGGWAALAGAIILGPRLGKYGKDKKSRAIMGHNIPLAALGVFILWFGWYGFNAGSTTAATDLSIGRIAVTTNLAAASGALAAMITAWIVLGKPDASMALNGALAGLVSITAPCADVSPLSAVIIGLIGGVIVVFSVLFIDKVLKIDDPVGAISVHGVCGAFGTIAAGLFAQEQYGGVNGLFFGGGFGPVGVQLIGVVSVFIWAFVMALILFTVIKRTVGLRVSEEEELQGLDIGEHGLEAYAGFQIFNTEN
ncbi:ammonium transporter [Chitinispirillales bacterium ANBcel5]|uniref:ammonium transporter n=1 Tax=Cellulosispirillum alkaliphilum TaxID=3039283 RepID=UPI002A4E8F27|nr:ammonium transporter [Chitinispirillales bacterium ANBcel5]